MHGVELDKLTSKKVDMTEGEHSDNHPPAVPRPTHSPPTPNLTPPDPDVPASQTKEPTQTRHSHYKQHCESIFFCTRSEGHMAINGYGHKWPTQKMRVKIRDRSASGNLST